MHLNQLIQGHLNAPERATYFSIQVLHPQIKFAVIIFWQHWQDMKVGGNNWCTFVVIFQSVSVSLEHVSRTFTLLALFLVTTSSWVTYLMSFCLITVCILLFGTEQVVLKKKHMKTFCSHFLILKVIQDQIYGCAHSRLMRSVFSKSSGKHKYKLKSLSA